MVKIQKANFKLQISAPILPIEPEDHDQPIDRVPVNDQPIQWSSSSMSRIGPAITVESWLFEFLALVMKVVKIVHLC